MSDPLPSPRFPHWLGVAVVVLLSLQLGLSWIQGNLLHRQHREIQDLREDIQGLSDTLEQLLPQDSGEDTSLVPMRDRIHRRPWHIQRMRALQEAPEEDKSRKELEESSKSAQKAVAEARDAQSKLSIEENARKAEEKQKIEAAQNSWQKWLWIALGAGLLALLLRSWLKHRP